ncbi:MAG TPA: hypothetical protein PK772_02515 [Chitinophagaceae bacterium]|nr:hypothetical protein [Chitinophagaceae bacterium]
MSVASKIIVDKICALEQSLDKLSREYDVYKDANFENLAFENAAQLLAKLEDKLHVITHEISSEIGFMRNDIEQLIKFIEFKKRHSVLSNEALTAIIDKNISVEKKNALIHELKLSIKDGIHYLEDVRKDWNKTFNNKDFSPIAASINK